MNLSNDSKQDLSQFFNQLKNNNQFENMNNNMKIYPQNAINQLPQQSNSIIENANINVSMTTENQTQLSHTNSLNYNL